MTKTTMSIAGGVLVVLGGMYVFLTHEQWEKMQGENASDASIERTLDDKRSNEVSQSGSWGDKNDNGSPIVYQKNKVLNYGNFTVHYDVWFSYAKVNGAGVTEVLRRSSAMEGTRYTSKDRKIEFINVNGKGSLIVDGEVVASGELQNREEIEAMGPTSCLAISDQVIEGCQ